MGVNEMKEEVGKYEGEVIQLEHDFIVGKIDRKTYLKRRMVLQKIFSGGR